MAIVQVKDATGSVLDWMVAKCEGYRATIKSNEVVYVHPSGEWHHNGNWCPSRNWAQGGPIIERGLINTYPRFTAGRTEGGSDVYQQNGWAAYVTPPAFWVTPRPFTGPTPLIAAMRCYVSSVLGNEVEVPDELI